MQLSQHMLCVTSPTYHHCDCREHCQSSSLPQVQVQSSDACNQKHDALGAVCQADFDRHKTLTHVMRGLGTRLLQQVEHIEQALLHDSLLVWVC